MAPILQRSTADSHPGSQPPPQSQPQDDSATGVTNSGLSVGGIIAIAFGILLGIFLGSVVFSVMSRRRKQHLSGTSKSMAQANFFNKLASDQRDIESRTQYPSNNRDTIWGRDSFLYAAPTGRDSTAWVMENPGAVWKIKPLPPVVVR